MSHAWTVGQKTPDGPASSSRGRAVRQALSGRHPVLRTDGAPVELAAGGRDFVVDDLIMVIMANGGIRATSPASAVAASRRFAALLIQSFAAHPGSRPLPPAVRLALLEPVPG